MTETISSAMRSRKERLFASLASMRWRYAIVLLLAFAAIIVTAAQYYRAIDRELTDVALSRRAAVAQLAAATLSEKLAHLVDVTVSLATRVRFRELVAEGKWGEASEILRAVPRDFPFVERLFLADVEGTLRADVPELPGMRGMNFADRDWYKGVRRDWHPYVSSVYRRAAAPQLNVFAIAAPISSASGGVSGILVLQVRVDSFFEWAKAIELGSGGFVYVVDPKGRLAFHSRFPAQVEIRDFSAGPVVQRLLRGERGVEIAFDPFEQEDSVSAYAPTAGHGWGVVAQQPTRTAFASKNQQLRNLSIAYGLTLLFCVSVAYLASRIVVERGRSQEVLLRQAAVLQSILDSLGDGVTVTDKNMKVLLINPVARRITGLEPGDPPPTDWAAVQGRYMPDMVTPFPPDRLFITRALRGECVDDEEVFIRNRRFPEGLWISGTARPIASDGVVHQAVVVWRDITERRRAESQIRALNEELEQRADQLEATNKELEGFSYSVSHDLRSPLRAIDGYSQILEEDYADKLDEEGRRLFGVIRESSQKMAILIDDLLTFSKLGRQAIIATTVDMNVLVKEVIRELRAAGAGKSSQIVVADLPKAWGDRALLKQVWINLLSNAIKFAGGKDKPIVEVSGNSDAAEDVYSVTDNGVGFDMQYYNKLFGVFQRLHSADEFPGTGVGLAIVQRIVTRLGGRVWAEGKLNEGAAFFFALPLGEKNA